MLGARNGSSRVLLCSLSLALVSAPSTGLARGKGIRECKPSSPAVDYPLEGAHDALQMLEARGQRFLLTTDDAAKPTKFKLLSSQGDAIELGKPQVTTEPTHFVARGQGIYAAGSVRSLTSGKKDVVLVRWGSDPRPRATVLSTTDRVDAKPVAALVNEYVTVAWAEPSADGKSRLRAVSIDLEELKQSEIRELGSFAPGGSLQAFRHDKSVVLVWSAPEGLMRVVLDAHAKVTAPAHAVKHDAARALRGMQLCADRLWLLSDASGKEIAVSFADASGAVADVAKLPATPHAERLPMMCLDAGVVVAHPTYTEKSQNSVLWVTAIDVDGKKRERRLKDDKGTPDDVRSLQLEGASEPSGVFWVQGRGKDAKFVYRALGCQ